MVFGRFYHQLILTTAAFAACGSLSFASYSPTSDDLNGIRSLVRSGAAEAIRQMSFDRGLDQAKAHVRQAEENMNRLIADGSFKEFQEAIDGADLNRDLNFETSSAKTLLGIAAERCNLEMAQGLLNQGADPTVEAHKTGVRASAVATQRIAELEKHLETLERQRTKIASGDWTSSQSAKLTVKVNESVSVPCASTEECLEIVDSMIDTSKEDVSACGKTAAALSQAEAQLEAGRAKSALETIAAAEATMLPAKLEFLEQEVSEISEAIEAETQEPSAEQ